MKYPILFRLNRTSFAIGPLVMLTALIFAGCGGPGDRIRDIDSQQQAAPQPTQTEREISGQYNVSGAGANGNAPYSGLLTIAPQGDVYAFRWQLTNGTQTGTGIQIGNAVAASSAATGAGKECGVMLVKIASDGSLDGKIAMWSQEKASVIKAVRTEGRGFVGEYSISGMLPDGVTGFAGTMAIAKDGQGYTIDWLQDYETQKDQAFVAFGIWKGSVAAGSFGGRQCGFVLYDVSSNGNLEGNWGGQRAVTFGTESAKRQ